MHKLILSLPLLLAAFGVHAADLRVERIDVVDKGIYAIEAGSETADADTPTGAITAVTTARLIESAATIPARIGVEFGLRFVVVGEPEGAEVTLDIVNIYPEPGLRVPGSQTALHTSEYRRTKRVGDTAYLGYGLENDWELVPGTWTFQIWHDGRKLVEETFAVVE